MAGDIGGRYVPVRNERVVVVQKTSPAHRHAGQRVAILPTNGIGFIVLRTMSSRENQVFVCMV